MKKPFRILLVEDNPGDTRLVREAFCRPAEHAFDLECVERLSDGLDRLKAKDFDMVYLDLCLPDSCGLETLARVHSRHPTIPITVFSGIDDELVRAEAFKAGAADYVVKGRWPQLM